MSYPNHELAVRQGRLRAAQLHEAGAIHAPTDPTELNARLAVVGNDDQPAVAPNTKPISGGDFLLWRKFGQQLRKGVPGGPKDGFRNPRFRHPTREAAEAEARRLLKQFPESTFIVLQEVARVKMKPTEAANG